MNGQKQFLGIRHKPGGDHTDNDRGKNNTENGDNAQNDHGDRENNADKPPKIIPVFFV